MQPEPRADVMVASGTDADGPFRYGWRYIRRRQPDGTEVINEVPLSLEDLLYPEEGDYVVQQPWHTQDFTYCYSTLKAWAVSRLEVVVLGDNRVDWGVEGIRPLGPDVLVLFEVREWLQRGTFHLAEEGGRPVLVVEIASPETRQNDLGIKGDFYYQVGVQKYVIIDRGPHGDDPVQLLGYERGPDGWQPLPLDAQGRLSLDPIGLVLGIADERPWLYDAVTGVREPDRPEWRQALADVETRAQAAETRAQVAEARAQAEAQARVALEERLRALETRLRPQPGE